MVGITLIVSWFVAVIFTPHLGVKLLPDFKKGEGHGEHVPFQTPFHRALRWLIRGCVKRPYAVVSITFAMFVAAMFGFTRLQQQFFPLSSRTELMVDVRLHEGSSIQATENMVRMVEERIRPFLEEPGMDHEPLIQHFTSYIGAGSARFFLALNPDLPNPSFGKIVIQTSSVYAREELRARLKKLFEQDGQFADASMRVLRLEFGPPTGYPVQFRVSIGPHRQFDASQKMYDKSCEPTQPQSMSISNGMSPQIGGGGH